MRNIKKPSKKTTLSRETLRRLDNVRLQEVMGGEEDRSPTAGCSYFNCTTADQIEQ